jgi:hypothetical protein
MTLSITKLNIVNQHTECRDCLKVMLSILMVNVVMLSVVMLNVVIPSIVMLNVIMLSVVMLNVVMLSLVVPILYHFIYYNVPT